MSTIYITLKKKISDRNLEKCISIIKKDKIKSCNIIYDLKYDNYSNNLLQMNIKVNSLYHKKNKENFKTWWKISIFNKDLFSYIEHVKKIVNGALIITITLNDIENGILDEIEGIIFRSENVCLIFEFIFDKIPQEESFAIFSEIIRVYQSLVFVDSSSWMNNLKEKLPFLNIKEKEKDNIIISNNIAFEKLKFYKIKNLNKFNT